MMINQLMKLLTEDFKFFTNLTIEHILISLLAISIASVLGIILGIIISEYRRFSGLNWLSSKRTRLSPKRKEQ